MLGTRGNFFVASPPFRSRPWIQNPDLGNGDVPSLLAWARDVVLASRITLVVCNRLEHLKTRTSTISLGSGCGSCDGWLSSPHETLDGRHQDAANKRGLVCMYVFQLCWGSGDSSPRQRSHCSRDSDPRRGKLCFLSAGIV